MIKVNKNNTIYVLCPAYVKTGGPELLHQLVCELNKQNKKAIITYFDYNQSDTNYTHDSFKKYVNCYKLIDEIIDDEKNIIVFPETFCHTSKLYTKSKKVLWWLSVDNYLQSYGVFSSIKRIGLINFLRKIKHKQVHFDNKVIYNFDFHLCQSYYAIDFLKKKGINDVGYLSDYINDIYFEKDYSKEFKKENNVLYNPKKGFDFTKHIIENSNNLNWIPIINMTNDEVRDLLSRSKVYIDFGNHPGKDRFPREAAISGCCVITGKKGAANYYEDVPISNEFKFEDTKENILNIKQCIEKCLYYYEQESLKFEKYRDFISSEKQKFSDCVEKVFEWSDIND